MHVADSLAESRRILRTDIWVQCNCIVLGRGVKVSTRVGKEVASNKELRSMRKSVKTRDLYSYCVFEDVLSSSQHTSSSNYCCVSVRIRLLVLVPDS